MIRYPFVVLFLVGLCVSAAFPANEGYQPAPATSTDQAQTQAADVQRGDVNRSTQIQTQAAPPAPAPGPGFRCGMADRAGPVPFADLGSIGGGQLLTDQKAIDQDRRLGVCGELTADDLILHLPPGTIRETLSLRNDRGLDIRRADLMRISRWDGDDLHIALAGLGLGQNPDLGNLWVWGTGPESASLLQRVAVAGVATSTVARTEPLNEPNMMTNRPPIQQPVGAPLPPEKSQPIQQQDQQQPVQQQEQPQSQAPASSGY